MDQENEWTGKTNMNHLNERIHSALDLFLHGCRIWAEIQDNQPFLNEMENIREAFRDISSQSHDEETVSLVEKMTVRVLSDMDMAMKDMGFTGIKVNEPRH